MNHRPLLMLVFAFPLAAQAQSPGHLAIGYGAQSSYQHPDFVTAEFGVAVPKGWLVAGTVRHSSWNGMSGWRAQLTLQRSLSLGAVRPYAGLGPSWTNENGEQDWGASQFGAMVLVGLELPPVRAGRGTVRLFGELNAYTHHYATGQGLFGVRWHFGR